VLRVNESTGDAPNLDLLRGVVAPEILSALETASAKLREAGIPHALAGGLAVGAHGYPRTTDDVDFLVGDEAYVHHAGGLVTLKVPLIAVGNVRVDFVSIDESKGGRELMQAAIDSAPQSQLVPIVPLTALIHMKLAAGRQKDLADVVELLKRGVIDPTEIDRHLQTQSPKLINRWRRAQEAAAREE
jgi:hypothetical protein